jgi:hypothetical protein
MYKSKINPYDGDVYHENPIVLYFTSLIISNSSQIIQILYITLDVVTGILLFLAATKFIKDMVKMKFNCRISKFFIILLCSMRSKRKSLKPMQKTP